MIEFYNCIIKNYKKKDFQKSYGYEYSEEIVSSALQLTSSAIKGLTQHEFH